MFTRACATLFGIITLKNLFFSLEWINQEFKSDPLAVWHLGDQGLPKAWQMSVHSSIYKKLLAFCCDKQFSCLQHISGAAISVAEHKQKDLLKIIL